VPLQIFHHPDELWQYLEPAHHLVARNWVIPWEYRDEIRTWLIPFLLAPPMALGRAIAPHGDLPLLFVKAMLALLSLLVVATATLLGLRVSRLHGAITGFVAATWVDLVYFAPRAMSESIALALFLPAAWLLSIPFAERRRGHVLAAGLLVGLCFTVRFQLAPALLVIAIAGCRGRLRDAWLPFAAGATLGLGIDGIADGLMAQTPFAWILRNLSINLIHQRSADYGVAPVTAYFFLIFVMFGWFALAILPLALVGARRYPALLAAALVNFAVHTLIPHKELRFVLLSIALVVILAGLGTAEVVAWLSRGRGRRVLTGSTVIACLSWSAASIHLAMGPEMAPAWRLYSNLILPQRTAAAVPGVCGLAIHRDDIRVTAAYTLFDRDAPIYLYAGNAGLSQMARSRSFNVVIMDSDKSGAVGQDYRPVRCFPGGEDASELVTRCVYARPGGCAGPWPRDHEINTALVRADK
jgi:hypothetical protein